MWGRRGPYVGRVFLFLSRGLLQRLGVSAPPGRHGPAGGLPLAAGGLPPEAPGAPLRRSIRKVGLKPPRGGGGGRALSVIFWGMQTPARFFPLLRGCNSFFLGGAGSKNGTWHPKYFEEFQWVARAFSSLFKGRSGFPLRSTGRKCRSVVFCDHGHPLDLQSV